MREPKPKVKNLPLKPSILGSKPEGTSLLEPLVTLRTLRANWRIELGVQIYSVPSTPRDRLRYFLAL